MLSEIKYPDSIRNYIYQCYVNQFAYPEDCVDLQKEIEQLYTDNVISDCYLDGYFWALPFDADPYKIALEIQEEERSKNNIKANDRKTQTNSQNNTQQQSSKPAVEQVKLNSNKNKSNIIIDYGKKTIKKIINDPTGIKTAIKNTYNIFKFLGKSIIKSDQQAYTININYRPDVKTSSEVKEYVTINGFKKK